MVLEKPIIPILVWLAQHVGPFFSMLLAAICVGVFAGFLASSLRHGPAEAVRMTGHTLWMALRELLQISPRRLLAIARLAFQEAMRRRVLVVFAIFLIGLLFAGWFLDPDSQHPGRLYLGFVLTSTNFLILTLAIMLSAFSLPTDMKNRTIYTVVTKPVRGWEIVVGRVLGLSAVGTLLLVLMCIMSYAFVVRGLQHDHTVDPQDLAAVTEGSNQQAAGAQKQGQTSRRQRHRHAVTVQADGQLKLEPAREHTHDVISGPTDNGRGVWQLGAAKGHLVARVPVMGEMWFLDRSGKPSIEVDKVTGQPIGRGRGINIGAESKYRSYVEGGTLSAAIWRFKGLRPEDYPVEYLPFEMTIHVFRTFKGDIEKGIRGTIQLVRPAKLTELGVPAADQLDGGLRSVEWTFTADDDGIYQPNIPRKIKARDASGQEREVDVFQDLVDSETGELEVWIRCQDRGQLLGMAPADLYLRNRNQPVWFNFVKGYLSIWMQMLVVTVFGVMFSTFLSGSVAMIATATAMALGYFKSTVFDVATGAIPGGGPLESLVRIVRQWGQVQELEPGVGTYVMKQIDGVLLLIMQAASSAMPNCGDFNTSNFVAYGFDVPPDLMAQQAITMLAYFLCVSAAGYFFFKTREIAA